MTNKLVWKIRIILTDILIFLYHNRNNGERKEG